MKNTKHTPAPWKIQSPKMTEQRLWLIGEDGVIAKIGGVKSPEEIEANARLIAAAPELLEALQMMVAMVCRTELENLPQVKSACETIAKAKGE